MIELRYGAFEPYQELLAHQSGASLAGKSYGATCSFVGTLRDFNEGASVSGMYLEHYPGMTEKFLERISLEARSRWQCQDILLIHRVGEIPLNAAIVLIAVWSSHRGDAFDACRYIIEELKSRAPFWKRETRADGKKHWVETNSKGYHEASTLPVDNGLTLAPLEN